MSEIPLGAIKLMKEIVCGSSEIDLVTIPSPFFAVYGLAQFNVYCNNMTHCLMFVLKFVTSSLKSTIMLSE